MVSNFSLQTRLYHDLTVEDATGCVFMKGSGVDLNFDHHTYLPYENLFTEIASAPAAATSPAAEAPIPSPPPARHSGTSPPPDKSTPCPIHHPRAGFGRS